MRKITTILIFCCLTSQYLIAQNFGDFTNIKKEKLLSDLDLLYQALDEFHSGMYWYTPKDSVDIAFEKVRSEIDRDLNVLEFHKLIRPLVALSRENHTNVNLPKSIRGKINSKTKFFPFTVVFLGREMYCVRNTSDFQDFPLEGKEIELINGESPKAIVDKIGELLMSDGFIKTVKFHDLGWFFFSKYYYYYYGESNQFEIKFKGIEEPIIVNSVGIKMMNERLKERYKNPEKDEEKEKKDVLEFKIINDSIAYLGVHTFSNTDIKDESKEKNIETFFKNSFKSIEEKNIKTVIVDVSKNSGGTEGNASLLYSYFGENFQKYKQVKVSSQKVILDDGINEPIKLKALGFFEKFFGYKKMKDGSMLRKKRVGKGLMAYKKEPKNKFKGKVYVITGPITYSGGSEFCNMMYAKDLATFVGQETGGGYLGNTSGYNKKLVLPNSKIEIGIPVLQFVMNVEPKLPFGRGVIPHYRVIPTFEEYIKNENPSLQYILEELEK